MNPINALNQEFARLVVAEWSDEAAIRQEEQGAGESRVGIVAAIQALVGWVRVSSTADKDSTSVSRSAGSWQQLECEVDASSGTVV
jgi:hypothetical protein